MLIIAESFHIWESIEICEFIFYSKNTDNKSISSFSTS